MVTLLARVTEDGYLFGATESQRGWYDNFWPEEMRDGADTIEISVPEDMKQALLDHGTSDQYYSDGDEAWQDVLKRGTFKERN